MDSFHIFNNRIFVGILLSIFLIKKVPNLFDASQVIYLIILGTRLSCNTDKACEQRPPKTETKHVLYRQVVFI